jgi:cytochrome c peroxidase
VLGVPQDKQYRALSPDKGRWDVNPAVQTEHAFRTGTVRNAARTAPYMHNGVFSTLGEVIDFYDGGGGAGRGLPVPNQTLSSDSLHLSGTEKRYLLAFIRSLDENISLEAPPVRLPRSKIKALNRRSVGGLY